MAFGQVETTSELVTDSELGTSYEERFHSLEWEQQLRRYMI